MSHEQRLLDIETARVRHAWAKAQILGDGETPALLTYLKESFDDSWRLYKPDLKSAERRFRHTLAIVGRWDLPAVNQKAESSCRE